MGMVDFQRLVITTPRAALDEAAFQRLKHEDFRQPTLFIASACAVLVFSLWLWDWAIDARHAPETFWLRILLAVSTMSYPLALRAGLRRGLPLVFYAMLVWLQAVFLLILARLEGGALHGVAGFLFWFIVPPLMSFILPLRANILGNLAVLAAPSLLAGTFGMLPGLDLMHLNAALIPACGIIVVGHVMVDRLLRRIYDYRWQLEWRSVAIDALAEGVVIIQEGLIRYANQAAAALVGRRPPEIVGAPLADYVRIDETTDIGQPLRVAVHRVHHLLRRVRAGDGKHARVHLLHERAAAVARLGAEAASDDHAAVRGERLGDRVEALLHRFVDETAGVDDDEVGAVEGLGRRVALGAELG